MFARITSGGVYVRGLILRARPAALTALSNSRAAVQAVGFISGAGYAKAPPLRATDSPGIVAWINAYCAAHPLDEAEELTGDAVAVRLER